MKTSQPAKIIFSCFLASTLEIYDLAIFGFLGSALHQNYLTFLDKKTALFTTFVFFAVGFLFRPLGSVIFGYIGDKYGRKKALVSSVSLMGISSLIMFLLPSYFYIGIASCYLIVLVRIIQGISVGGEFTGAIIFTMEHMEERNKGFAVGILTAGGACGVLLANVVSKILQNPSLPAYSWRFAFLIGFSLALVGYFIRKKLDDTTVFKHIRQQDKIPLLHGLKTHKIECLSTLFVAAANGTSFYFGSVFLSKHLTKISGYDYGYISILVSITMFMTLPIFGFISEKFSRKKYLLYSSLTMSIVSVLIIRLIVNVNDPMNVSILAMVYALFAAMMIGAINIYAAEIFPAEFRMSCMSLSYSLGMGFIGGTVPAISDYIAENYTNPEVILGSYVGCVCLLATISIVAIIFKQKKRVKD